MNTREKEILQAIAESASEMSDFKKGELLGYAKALADSKVNRLACAETTCTYNADAFCRCSYRGADPEKGPACVFYIED